MVARVLERLSRALEGEQLDRIDRLERQGRHAELHRIERHVTEEPPPLGVGLVPLLHVVVVVALPVPAELRHLGHGVDVAQDVFPVGLEVARLGHEARHPHDGHVRRLGALHPAAALLGEGRVVETVDPVRSTGRHLIVQIADRPHLVVERRRLSEHVGALGVLVPRTDGHEGRIAVAGRGLGPALESLGRDAQTVEHEGFELFLDLGRRPARLGEPLPVFEDRLGEGRVGAAQRVTGRRLHELGAGAVENLLLVGFHDRLGFYSVLGEKVGCSHEQTDLDAPLGEGCGHGGGHRRREAVVDPAAEEHVIVGRIVGRNLFEERIDSDGPEFETAARPHTSAALAALEDESFRSFGKEGGETVSRARVNIDARLGSERICQSESLIGRVARDHGEGGAARAHRVFLLRGEIGRERAEDSHAPGMVGQRLAPLGKKLLELCTARMAESHKGQRALFGDTKAEGGLVADADHRGLDDRILGAVRRGQGRRGVEGTQSAGRTNSAVDRLADSFESTSHGKIFFSQTGRGGGIGAERHDLRRGIVPSHEAADLLAPGSELFRTRTGAAQDRLLFVAQGIDHGAVGLVENPEGCAELLADTDRIVTVVAGDDLLRRAG